MRKRHLVRRRACAAIAISVASSTLYPPAAPAQTATWTGTGADNNWWDPANWSTGSVPNSQPVAVVFGAAPRLDPSLIWGPVTTQSVTFAPDAAPYTLSASRLYTSSLTNDSPNAQTITSAVQGNGSFPIPNLTITANGPILFDSSFVTAHTLQINAHSDVTITSTLEVNGSLTKTGTGTLTIGGAANHHVHPILHVAAGTLALAMSPTGSLYTQGTLDIGNEPGTQSATLRFDADNQNLTNAPNLRVFRNSSLNFNGHTQSIPNLNLFGTATNPTPAPQAFSSLYVHPTGTFDNAGGGAINASTFYVGGTFNHSGGGNLTAGNLFVDGTLNSPGNATINANLVAPGGGTLNAPTGTLVTAQISTQGAPTTSTINASIDLAGQLLTINGTHHHAVDSDLDINGTISNGTGLTLNLQPQANPPTVRLAGTSPNSYSGQTTVSAGTLALAKSPGVHAVPGDVRLNATPGYPFPNAAKLRLDASEQIPDTATVTLEGFNNTFDLNGHAETIAALSGNGTVNLGDGGALTLANSNDASFAGNVTGTGTLRKAGSNTLTLLGSTYNPGTSAIDAGTLVLGSTLPNIVSTLAGNITVGDGSAPALLKTSGNINSASTGGRVVGALTINANATVDLSANPNNTGFGSTFSFPSLAGAGTLILPNNAALTISTASSSTFSGTIAGTGTGTGLFTKSGTATLTLAGPKTYSFTNTALHEGTLVLAKPDGTTAIPGTITIVHPTLYGPGPATLRLAAHNQTTGNSITVNANGTLDLAGFDTAAATLALAGGAVTTGPGLLTANTYTQSAGSFSGNLRSTSATLTGGSFNGDLTTDSFSYQNGTFTGHLTVNTTATFSNNFSASNGMTAYANVTVAAGRSLTFGGSGLDNQGSLTFSGGTLGGTGPIVNSNRIAGFGSIAGTGGFTNNLLLSVTSGNLTLANSAPNTNYGNVDLATATQLICTGGPLTNHGTISLAASSIAGSATLLNNSSIIGRGLISVPVVNTGTIQPQSGTINLTQPFLNAGLIKLSTGSSLAGAAVHNTGTIQGDGTVSNPVSNHGNIEPVGTLQLAGQVTNPAGGLISLPAGSKLLLSQGLDSSAGLISLIGGTFDNNNHPLTNTGQITGFGTLRTGGAGLTNDNAITLTGGTTTINGPVTNNPGKTIEVRFTPAIFTSPVTNNGLFKITQANVTFAAGSTGIPLAPDSFVPLAASTAAPSPGLVGTGAVVVDPAGALTAPFLRQTSLTSSGAVKLHPSSLGGDASTLATLTLLPTSTLDLADNPLTVTTTPAATLCQYLLTQTLFSSLSDPTHTLAYLTTPTSTLVKLSLTGDANLDGLLNADDFALLDRGYFIQGSLWQQGDFNYDGIINSQDYFLLDRTYLLTHAPSPSLLATRESQFGPAYVHQLLTAIPEPSALLSTLCFLLSSPLLPRRRSSRF